MESRNPEALLTFPKWTVSDSIAHFMACCVRFHRERKKKWPEHLKEPSYAYNPTPHSSTRIVCTKLTSKLRTNFEQRLPSESSSLIATDKSSTMKAPSAREFLLVATHKGELQDKWNYKIYKVVNRHYEVNEIESVDG